MIDKLNALTPGCFTGGLELALACDLLVAAESAAVAGLAREILDNSPGTNRIVKALIADRSQRTRTDALTHERALPHGMPDDTAERMRAGGR